MADDAEKHLFDVDVYVPGSGSAHHHVVTAVYGPQPSNPGGFLALTLANGGTAYYVKGAWLSYTRTPRDP